MIPASNQTLGEKKPNGGNVEDEPEDSVDIATEGRNILGEPITHALLQCGNEGQEVMRYPPTSSCQL